MKYRCIPVVICACFVAWLHADHASSILPALRGSILPPLHKTFVRLQNRYSRSRTAYSQTPYTRPVLHCSELFERVYFIENVLPLLEFENIRVQLYAIKADMGLRYETSGRSSRVLSAAETAYLAPSLSRLHHERVWSDRLSKAAGTSLYPLDDMRFPMAYSTHYYTTGSFNAPHRDSYRTDSKTWTVIYGIDNNSSSELIVDGVECKLPNNAALLFEGSEWVHWVPKLTLPDGTREESVARTVVFLEYTESSPDHVCWRWPWRKSIAWAERILFH